MTLDTILETARSLWGLWLMLVFLSIVAWAFWPGNSRKFEGHGQIPFKDEGRS